MRIPMDDNCIRANILETQPDDRNLDDLENLECR